VAVDAAFLVHFDSLERRFKDVLGFECPWSAGATLLNAGADPWKFWLFDQQLSGLPLKERAGYSSELVHPQSQIEAGVQFLVEAYRKFAVPLFQRLQTYRDLADFYANSRTDGVYWPLFASARNHRVPVAPCCQRPSEKISRQLWLPRREWRASLSGMMWMLW